MKKIALRILLLLAIFAGSLIVFMLMLNSQDAFSTKAMSDTTLPVLYIDIEGTTVNRMYGYRQEVNEKTFRESLTPVSANKEIVVEIQANNADIKDASYQVTSLKDGSVIENGRLSLKKSDGNIISEFQLINTVPVDQEYTLRFAVNIGEDLPVYYYTRLIQNNGQNLSNYLDYANAFYQSCINDSLTDEMLSQLETESSSSNSSLHGVTLKSDKEQITWGNLEPVIVKKAIPTILEVNGSTVSIGMEYIVSAQDESGKTEYYTASEYYRMRKSSSEIIILNYERTVTQIFDGSASVLSDDGINLGVTGSDLEYNCNTNGDIVAFVQAGELYQYDRSSNKVCRIFSFREDTHTDERRENNSHGISISSVSEEGNTTFIVYGYMAAGDHEGKLGISVYRYYSESNTTRELIFIPLTDGYEAMSLGLSLLSYVSETDCCYLYYDSTIYSVEIGEEISVYEVENLPDRQTVSVSKSQTLIAWGETLGEYSESISRLDLESGKILSINAPEGDYIKVLGFVNEDLVYGLAHAKDCNKDTAGNNQFPMYRIIIYGTDGGVKADYSADNIYVTEADINTDVIILKRVEYIEGQFTDTTDDQLLYYFPEDASSVTLSLKVSERNGTQVYIMFSVYGESSNLLNMDARYSSANAVENYEIPEMVYEGSYYYVYAHGDLYAIHDLISDAIIDANENMGVVLDSEQKHVWERGDIKSTAILEPSNIPQGLLDVPKDELSLAEALGEKYATYNLTGCSLESLYYQLSRGYAVIGRWSSKEYVLILGYDIYDNIWIYNTDTGESYAVAFEDAEEAFEKNGNTFISYTGV